MKHFFFLLTTGLGPALAAAQAPAPSTPQLAPLTVEKIMREPAQWLGTSPTGPYWSEDGRQLYFHWNPEKARRDSLYGVSPTGSTPRKLTAAEVRALPPSGGQYDLRRTRKVYEKDGDIYLLDLKPRKRDA